MFHPSMKMGVIIHAQQSPVMLSILVMAEESIVTGPVALFIGAEGT